MKKLTWTGMRWLGLVFVLTLCCGSPAASGQWKPAAGPLLTKWAADVVPDRVLPEYPRPQMVRKEWKNLNGLWDYAIRPRDDQGPSQYDGQILVPFPIESALSGVMKPVGEPNRLWYRRSFQVSPDWKEKDVLLHFGAVDWETVVWVNGQKLGEHRGGYDPFTVNVTSAVRAGEDNELVVGVWDPSDAGTQPRGKQIRRPHGIWYTPTTGIWQTVWLEAVPSTSISSLKINSDIELGALRIAIEPRGQVASDKMAGWRVAVSVLDGQKQVGAAAAPMTDEVLVKLDNPKLWSPDEPFLYSLKVTLRNADGETVDEVESYAGLRKISLGKDADGITRLLLNGAPLFQFGPLDQGFWPDGLYTAPTDEALRYDIEMTRKLGFNMARKHVKVEPDRWYYWCDRLGLLVWQDMPSGDKYIGARDPDAERTEESARQYEAELSRMIAAFRNHPSIVMWVPFNEGWGQFDTARIAKFVKKLDPTRLVNSASGWTDRGVGDVHDIHVYPGPGSPQPEPDRAAVLGEFGGLGLPVRGHTWQDEKNWGYRSFTDAESLTQAYLDLIRRLRPLIHRPGLSAAVYTQTTDVEIEVNGLMTYDRAQLKMDLERIATANRKVYLPPPIETIAIPTSREKPATWRYTTKEPAAGWEKTGFDDSSWDEGKAGFGTEGTPGASVRTVWKDSDIWLRRTIDIPADMRWSQPTLMIHHDEDAEIYIQGTRVASLKGYTTDYASVPLEPSVRELLRGGKVLISVHCRQTGGGQYIDVGLADLREQERSTSRPTSK